MPRSYLIPPGNATAIALLRAHGIIVSDPTIRDVKGEVEEFQIESNTQAQNESEGHRERTVTGKWVRVERVMPEGTRQVVMEQPLARLAFYLLEPRSDDGLVTWNVLDHALTPEAKVYPIYRTVR